jgi:hypothetical protein
MTRQFLMFTSAIIILFNAAHAGDESRSSPKKPPLSPASIPTETWVWNEITAGRTGDLQKRCGVNLDSRDLNDPRWHDDCRNVSAAFITRALSESRWQQLLPAQGFRILGARVIGSINLTGAHISAPVWLVKARSMTQS